MMYQIFYDESSGTHYERHRLACMKTIRYAEEQIQEIKRLPFKGDSLWIEYWKTIKKEAHDKAGAYKRGDETPVHLG